MDGEITQASALNLCRGEWDHRILEAAGYLSIGQVLDAGELGLRIAASKIGAPYRHVMIIQEIAAHHGLEIPLLPAENAEGNKIDDHQPNGHDTELAAQV